MGDRPNLAPMMLATGVVGAMATRAMAEGAAAVTTAVVDGIVAGVNAKRIRDWETRIDELCGSIENLLLEIDAPRKAGILSRRNLEFTVTTYMAFRSEYLDCINESEDGYELYFALDDLETRMIAARAEVRMRAALDGLEGLGELQLLKEEAEEA